jgi:putative glycosyltransferase (TIGR04372 family)
MESFSQFAIRQFKEINKKSFLLKLSKLLYFIVLLFPSLFGLILIRLLSPFLLIRFAPLYSNRIGHCAQNTDLYLIRKLENIGLPSKPYIDIFYLQNLPIANKQLIKMWKRKLLIFPRILMIPIVYLNHFFPDHSKYEVDIKLFDPRDTDNIFDKYEANISFTFEEENRGKMKLEKLGIPNGSKFVALIVRDSGYLKNHLPEHNWTGHNYRDCEIDNFAGVAEELARRNIYTIRMGQNVNKKFKIINNKYIIDYATNGMRTDFMDIYIGAKCYFTISTGCGYDSVPLIFRRPIVFVNLMPIGYQYTFSKKFIAISKHFYDNSLKRMLSIEEIVNAKLHLALDSEIYNKKNILLIENTPEEITDVVLEQLKWLKDFEIFPSNNQFVFWNKLNVENCYSESGIKLHGKIVSRYGEKFLIQNQYLLS